MADSTGRVKILKREKNPSVEVPKEERSHESSISNLQTARAQILGDDFDVPAQEPMNTNPADSAAAKARYRGRDSSEVDPDYVRAPGYGFQYFPAGNPVQQPQAHYDTFDQYPSLGDAYRPMNPTRRS